MGRKRPKGARYRNLYLRGAAIYYERRVGDRRIKVSTKTSDWAEAAAVRDELERRKNLSGALPSLGAVPRFGEFAERYLAELYCRRQPRLRERLDDLLHHHTDTGTPAGR